MPLTSPETLGKEWGLRRCGVGSQTGFVVAQGPLCCLGLPGDPQTLFPPLKRPRPHLQGTALRVQPGSREVVPQHSKMLARSCPSFLPWRPAPCLTRTAVMGPSGPAFWGTGPEPGHTGFWVEQCPDGDGRGCPELPEGWTHWSITKSSPSWAPRGAECQGESSVGPWTPNCLLLGHPEKRGRARRPSAL